MKRDIASVVERMEQARHKGAKTMWYALAMDALLDIFLKQNAVTRDELKALLMERRHEHRDNELLRIGYDEAIEQLTDPISPSIV